jgi:hypothetical protein
MMIILIIFWFSGFFIGLGIGMIIGETRENQAAKVSSDMKFKKILDDKSLRSNP